jgi:hypothetical protein
MALGWEHAVTVVGAFASAGTAQYLSHRLTLNREDEKYQKERYQKFYAPLVYKIKNYVRAEANKFEKTLIDGGVVKELQEGVVASASITFSPPIPDPDTIFIEIISIIERNFQYADLQFIEMYERHKMLESQEKNISGDGFDDIRWAIRLTDNLLVCEKFLIEYLSFSEKVSVLSKEIENEIYKILTAIKLYNLMKLYKFHNTANILFPCAGKYRGVFADFPDIHLEIERVKEEVNSKSDNTIRHTGKDNIYCYQDLLDFARSIQKHIEKYESNWMVSRYSSPLELAIETDERCKEQSIL